MIIDLILIFALLFFIFLTLKYKAQLEIYKKNCGGQHYQVNKNKDEFTNFSFTSEHNNAFVDPLTKLPTREAFDDRLQQILNQSKRFDRSFGILLLDIRSLQEINQSYGYDVGDKLLIDAAMRLQALIRQVDSVTRYGGGKFIFLLPQLSSPETAVYVAQRLLDHIVQPFPIDDHHILASANIGVSIFPMDGVDAAMLLKNAEIALTQSKSIGKNNFRFHRQELHVLGQRELDIHKIIASDDVIEKLVIFYHPFIEVSTNQIVYIHAIPFIYLPDKGYISYMEFSKIAENCGKILEIGEWLLKTSLKQFIKWHGEGFKPEKLAINVTFSQIDNPHFTYKVSEILNEFKISPKNIIFDIAENNLIQKTDSLEKAFVTLSKLGIDTTLSIYALGHLAIQKITRLPIHYLKINEKLIKETDVRLDNERILHMIVSLANDMKIKIIAEGVENESQKAKLQQLGCDIMQGKLFGEPLLGDSH